MRSPARVRVMVRPRVFGVARKEQLSEQVPDRRARGGVGKIGKSPPPPTGGGVLGFVFGAPHLLWNVCTFFLRLACRCSLEAVFVGQTWAR